MLWDDFELLLLSCGHTDPNTMWHKMSQDGVVVVVAVVAVVVVIVFVEVVVVVVVVVVFVFVVVS